ncbi:MAG: SufD family Fe-S cluster assembly protein [Bacilli bacterium]
MNIINIVNKKITKVIDDSILIKVDNEISTVNKIIIDVISDTDLVINYNNDESEKQNIIINIAKDIIVNLFELRQGASSKIQYIYNIAENSSTYIYKFNEIIETKERTFINLNGHEAKINYNFKTISKNNEEYDFIISHNYKDTESHLTLNGVNIKEGTLIFNITGDIKKGNTNCIINQESRIISLNDNPCIIKPNLLIEEYEVSANHSALIGKFSDDEMFYLQSRGIPETIALNLLIKGFLLSKLEIFKEKTEILEQIINKYWR